MKVAFFSAKPYDVESFTAANEAFGHELEFFEDRLRGRATPLAEGFEAVCLATPRAQPATRDGCQTGAEQRSGGGFRHRDDPSGVPLGVWVRPFIDPNEVG